jgi:hypothetical protein
MSHKSLPTISSLRANDRLCDRLLTAACFPNDQDRGICWLYNLHSFQYIGDGATVPSDLYEVMFLADFFL